MWVTLAVGLAVFVWTGYETVVYSFANGQTEGFLIPIMAAPRGLVAIVPYLVGLRIGGTTPRERGIGLFGMLIGLLSSLVWLLVDAAYISIWPFEG